MCGVEGTDNPAVVRRDGFPNKEEARVGSWAEESRIEAGELAGSKFPIGAGGERMIMPVKGLMYNVIEIS